MKTQGEKTQADHEADWEREGRSAWAHGRACDPSSYVTDERLAFMWRVGWHTADFEQKQRNTPGAKKHDPAAAQAYAFMAASQQVAVANFESAQSSPGRR